MKILGFDAKYYEVESSLTGGVQLLREIKDPRKSGPSKKLANLLQKSQSTFYIGIGIVAGFGKQREGFRYLGSYAPDKIVSSYYAVPVRLISDLKREKIEYLTAYPWLVYWDLDGEKTGSRWEWEAEQWLFKDKVYFIYNKKEDYDEKNSSTDTRSYRQRT